MNRHEDNAGYLIIAIIAIPIVLFLIFYRKTETIVVDQRYWHYTVQVGHYETSVHVSCDSDGCTTSTSRDWEVTCTQASIGRELPPVAPELRCRDSQQRDYIVYRIEYHEQDDTKHHRGTFDGDMWDGLSPGSIITVKMNALGRVTEIKERHQ